MPKAPRFKVDISTILGPEPSYYVDSSFKSDKYKGVSIGIGSRKPYPDWM